MEWKDFCNNIKEMIELERHKNIGSIRWKIDDNEIIINFFFPSNRVLEFSYTKEEFLSDYKGAMEEKEMCIYNETYYEVPVSIRSDYFPIMPRYERILDKELKDYENNLEYVISRPSRDFWFKIVEFKIKINELMIFRRILYSDREFEFKDGVAKKDIFELLRMLYRHCITLKINSGSDFKKTEFQSLVDSFIFNINFNMDIGIRQIYDLESLYERRRESRFRKEAIDTISPPLRIYKKELVEQYNMAIISEDPFIKFLCYYHILEHFYESVYKEEMVKIVREQLTLPNFSIKKEKEIIKLVDIIKEKVKIEREEFDGNELEALELVIKKYVDVDKLKEKVDDINTELTDYYDKEPVRFSQGVPINFNDTINLAKNIAKRIYFTRNALVHYKSNEFSKKEKGMYRPFRDKKILMKEIVLMRILAEEVIISDSEIF